MKKRKGLSMRYQITSDSTCDLSPEQLEQYNIRLLPLYVSMDGKTLRDGVDVNVATFSVRNIKRDETMIRQIYVDGEKDFPPFEEGKSVHIISQGNLLIEYELMKENKTVCEQS